MKKVLIIGGATLDTIIAYEDMETMVHKRPHFSQAYLLLEEGKKIEVCKQQYSSGGGATNTAVSFKRQGFDIRLFCKMGKDAAGEMVKTELENLGIETNHVLYSNTEGTASSFVVPSLTGDRAVFAYRGANATLLSKELPLDSIAQADFIYISSLSKQSAEQLPVIVKHAQKHKIPVAINPGISQLKLGSSFLQSSLAGIDTLILNYEEAAQFMASLADVDAELREAVAMQDEPGAESRLLDRKINFQDQVFSLRQFFAEVLKRGPKVVVVTNGKKGVYVATKDKLYFHKGLTIKVVNTLGAGDAFGSSFVGALQNDKSISEAISYGVANSAAVIQHPDAKTGLMTLLDLEKQVVKMCQNSLITMSWGN